MPSSLAILDALKMFPGPMKLHISIVHRREAHHHHFYVSKAATAAPPGMGADGRAIAPRARLEMPG